MLEDQQLEVRLGASSTLSGMIRCSPAPLRARMVEILNEKFTKMLLSHPLPKKQKSYLGGAASGVSTPNTGTSTPTPEHTKLVITRHAASPPPTWIPGVLTTVSGLSDSCVILFGFLRVVKSQHSQSLDANLPPNALVISSEMFNRDKS